MLVARREPALQGEPAPPHVDFERRRPYAGTHGHNRLITTLQVIGTLVGIPVGLASAYSIYQSNFAVEARCESLRGSIVSMLDKRADASTLRMLVRRDVITFEKNCGSVDPDAVQAFKALLAAKPASPAPAPSPQVAHEPTRLPVQAARPAPPKAVPVETKPARRDAEASDANWINSVRAALTHVPAREEVEVKTSALAAPSVPAAAPPRLLHETAPPPRVVQGAQPAPLAQPAAPPLPAPVPVPVAAAPAPATDHPVPPGSIPDVAPAEEPADKPGQSWLAKIPLVNRMVGD
jgi:hypothetical protein